MTAIGPVDILCRDHLGGSVAVEIKRRGDIDGVEQLTRYLELMNRDPHLAPVTGVFAAQEIKPQARTLAQDRGIRCVTLDYDALRGIDDTTTRPLSPVFPGSRYAAYRALIPRTERQLRGSAQARSRAAGPPRSGRPAAPARGTSSCRPAPGPPRAGRAPRR